LEGRGFAKEKDNARITCTITQLITNSLKKTKNNMKINKAVSLLPISASVVSAGKDVWVLSKTAVSAMIGKHEIFAGSCD